MEIFKSEFILAERKYQTTQIKKQHPNRIPVFVCKKRNCKLDDIKKNKYLVPCDITVGQFMYILRKSISLKPDQGIFIFVDNILPPNGELMSSIYTKHADEDGFLYITFSHESVFG